MLNLILFGRQQSSNKPDFFTSPIGRRASQFRRKVMKNCVLQLQKGFVPEWNLKVSAKDLNEQAAKLTAKFQSLSHPVIGKERSELIQQQVLNLDSVDSLDALMEAAQ